MAQLLPGTKMGGRDIETAEGAQNRVNLHANTSSVHVSTTDRTKWNKAHDNTLFKDYRSENPTPAQCRAQGAYEFRDFKQAISIGIGTSYAGGTYVMLVTMCPYSDKSGGPVTQIAYCPNGSCFRRISKADDTSWNDWVQMLDRESGVGKSGGSFTGDISIDKAMPTIGFNVPNSSYNAQVYMNANSSVSYGLMFNINSKQALQIASETSVKIKTEGGSWYDINHLIRGQTSVPSTVQNGLFIAVYE